MLRSSASESVGNTTACTTVSGAYSRSTRVGKGAAPALRDLRSSAAPPASSFAAASRSFRCRGSWTARAAAPDHGMMAANLLARRATTRTVLECRESRLNAGPP